MIKINDLIVLKTLLKETKVGKMSNDGLRAYIKLSLTVNKYNDEFEDKRKNVITEAIANKGFDTANITQEQDRELYEIVAPILEEHLLKEVDVDTKVLSWQDVADGILNMDENKNLTVDDKTKLTSYLCKEEL